MVLFSQSRWPSHEFHRPVYTCICKTLILNLPGGSSACCTGSSARSMWASTASALAGLEQRTAREGPCNRHVRGTGSPRASPIAQWPQGLRKHTAAHASCHQQQLSDHKALESTLQHMVPVTSSGHTWEYLPGIHQKVLRRHSRGGCWSKEGTEGTRGYEHCQHSLVIRKMERGTSKEQGKP